MLSIKITSKVTQLPEKQYIEHLAGKAKKPQKEDYIDDNYQLTRQL
jgi:hypothetical protein